MSQEIIVEIFSTNDADRLVAPYYHYAYAFSSYYVIRLCKSSQFKNVYVFLLREARMPRLCTHNHFAVVCIQHVMKHASTYYITNKLETVFLICIIANYFFIV